MRELDAEDRAMIERVRARYGSHYDLLLEWQSLILAGQPKPAGLSSDDSAEYELLKNQLEAAGRLGYRIDIPDGGPSAAPAKPACAPPAEAADAPSVPPTEETPTQDYGVEIMRGVLGLSEEEIAEVLARPRISPPTPPISRGERGYLIVAQNGEALLLALRDEPMSPARIWTPGEGLSPVRMAANLAKFGIWEPYDGPQDALEGLVPDDCIPPGTVPPELQRPKDEPLPEVQRPMEEPPREPRPTYPDTDVMTRMLMSIMDGAEKPADLSYHESATWDRLAADVADARAQGLIIEIPPE